MLTETETYYVRIGFRVYVIEAETASHAIIEALILSERYGYLGKVIAISAKRPESQRKISENNHTV